MARKVIKKYFEDFKGLDLRSSNLTRPENFASVMENYEIRRDFAIESRKGVKLLGQVYSVPDGGGAPFEEVLCPRRGIHSYIYSYADPRGSTSGGSVKEELLGFSDSLYKLVPGKMTVAYTSVGVAKFSFIPTAAGWIADLQINGVSESGFPLNCGVPGPSSVTLEAVRAAIAARPNFTATLTPWARVNGDQAAVGTMGVPITVFAGHTITVSTSAPTRVELRNVTTGFRICRDVIAQTATSVTLRQAHYGGTIAVNNNEIIGVGLYPAPILPIVSSGTFNDVLSAVPVNYNFEYWEKVHCPHNLGDQRITTTTDLSFASQKNTVFVNNSNCCYMLPFLGETVTVFLGIAIPPSLNDFAFSLRVASNLLKYDGFEVYGADLPPGRIISAAATAGAGLSLGQYKYLVTYQQIDGRGNISESADFRGLYRQSLRKFVNQETVVTTTAGNQAVDITVPTMQATSLFGGLYRNYNHGIAANGGFQVYGTGVVSLTVTSASGAHSLRVGNLASWTNEVTGSIQREFITAISSTSITVTASEIGSIKAGSFVSNGLTVRVYRTKVGGNVYYLAKEVAHASGVGLIQSITDVTPDTSLVEQYIDPDPYYRDNPPVLSWLTSHQGLLVGTGDPLSPQSVYWSNPEDPSGWSVANNQLDVATFDDGPITCCASDKENMLAVFSPTGYYNVIGSFADLSLSIDNVAQGDVGCNSPHTLKKIRESLIYLSQKGFRVISGGSLTNFEDRLVSRFNNQVYTQVTGGTINAYDVNKYYFPRAIAVVDTEKQQYVCFIPKETTAASLKNVASGSITVYDFANDVWFDRSYSHAFAAGGMAIYKNNFIFCDANLLGSPACWQRNLTDTIYDFCDSTSAIVKTFRPQWDSMDEPSVDYVALDLAVYSFTRTATNGFTLTVKTYRNYQTSVADTNLIMPFGVNDIELVRKLANNKARALQLEFSNAVLYENPVITGYEYIAALSYAKDRLVR